VQPATTMTASAGSAQSFFMRDTTSMSAHHVAVGPLLSYESASSAC
jgi:hypothetical protein